MNKIVALLLLVFLVGCTDTTPPNTALITNAPRAPVAETRFTVSRISIFRDDLAYGGKRGIYIITDTKTGKEYIGVSGVGISEMSAHTQSMGKTVATVPDER